MRSFSGGEFNTDIFDGVYYYIIHLLNNRFEVESLHVHPNFYSTILKGTLWYEVRRAKDVNGFRYFETLQGIIIPLIINSAMDGNFCIITKLKNEKE